MNALRTLKVSALALGTIALATAGQSALAQTAAITATATLQNTVTLVVANQMNYGTVAVVPGDAGDNSEDVTVAITAAGVVTVTPGANESAGAVVDNTAASAANIEVTAFADGATINIDIQAVVSPTDGTGTLTFTNTAFSAAWNGGAAGAQTGGTPWTQVLDFSYNAGTNTLDLGASVVGEDDGSTYADGVYTGGFNVVFNY